MPEHNPFQAELEARNPFQAELSARGGSAAGVFSESAGSTFANNLLALPRGAGNLLAAGGAGIKAGFNKLLGRPGDFRGEFEEQQQQFPASALRSIPAPTVQQGGAALRSLPALSPGGESFTDVFRSNLERIQQDQAIGREAHPTAAGVGDVVGDVATLATGRLPAARGINRAESALLPRTPELLFGQAGAQIPSNVRFLLDKTLLSPAMRSLARGTGRSFETGFEAAVLDVMKGDDPLETAGLAAGGQAAGSLAVQASKALMSGGPLQIGAKIGLSALSLAGYFQVMSSITPGGENSPIEAVKNGFAKVALGLILGAGATLAGAGRLRGGQFAERFPKAMDFLATIPRAATISMLEDFVDAPPEEQQRLESITVKLTEDPEYFGESASSRLLASFNNGTLVSEISSLMDSAQFRERVFNIAPAATFSPQDPVQQFGIIP